MALTKAERRLIKAVESGPGPKKKVKDMSPRVRAAFKRAKAKQAISKGGDTGAIEDRKEVERKLGVRRGGK